MNVLFLTSGAKKNSSIYTHERRPPLGLGFVISVVRSAGHRVFFYDMGLQLSDFLDSDYLTCQHIDFVGIYSTTYCFNHTLEILRSIQAKRESGEWNGKIILGGPHTTVRPQTIPDYVDFIVRGEGEEIILDILSGQIQSRVTTAKRITNLDATPFAPWDIFIRMPYDFSGGWLDVHPVFTMNTSRGCPYPCTFCSVGAIWGPKYTGFSPERIIHEIEYLIKNYGAKGIFFREDNFTFNVKRTQQFCQQVLDKNLKFEWCCETRIDTLTDELVDIMYQSGCRAVYLGIESGSQRMLDKLKKGFNIEQAENAIKKLEEKGIRTFCSLMVGLPDETLDDYKATLKFLGRTKPYDFGLGNYVGIPGSKLYDYVYENGLYEYEDEAGMLYMPGYSIRFRYFQSQLDTYHVDVEFETKRLTELDYFILGRKEKFFPYEQYKHKADTYVGL